MNWVSSQKGCCVCFHLSHVSHGLDDPLPRKYLAEESDLLPLLFSYSDVLLDVDMSVSAMKRRGL